MNYESIRKLLFLLPGETSHEVSMGSISLLEKLNLALEMGDNIMLYVDDIQHCHPEFLQKFISLCDAQRRIEGVYKGKAKTYDLRGSRFAVVMQATPTRRAVTDSKSRTCWPTAQTSTTWATSSGILQQPSSSAIWKTP